MGASDVDENLDLGAANAGQKGMVAFNCMVSHLMEAPDQIGEDGGDPMAPWHSMFWLSSLVSGLGPVAY